MTDHPIRVYAHRGSSKTHPENTMVAFEHALEAGVTHLEMDVHVTRDHHVVVAHDAGGERMAGESALLSESTLSEIKKWDAGFGFQDAQGDFPFRGKGLRIPTLTEVLTAFPDVRLNIDIKHHNPDIVSTVIEVVRRHDATHRVLLSSFNPRMVQVIRKLGYEGMTGVSRTELTMIMLIPRWFIPRSSIHGLALQIPRKWKRYYFDNRRLIEKVHYFGKRVDYWVINEVEAALELLEMGADGIMTDDPHLILPPVREFAQTHNRVLD
ncbi:MAG: glycerophosphodiester phosphodiesterase [Leptospiraceae bacterium]|nr:glycerophosphodiester phosphodiesterase [Leptospiraceae bacterium]